MRKKVFSIAILFAVLSGCDDGFLDRAPYNALSSAAIWNSDESAVLAVNGIYRTFAQDSWYHIPYYTTNLSPEGYTIVRSDFGLAHATGTTTSQSVRIQIMYTEFYHTIKYANDAIAGLTDNPNVSPDLASRLIGEAEFYRGLSYFYLWQLFGGVVLLDRPVPVNETYLPRNTADEVKQLIISDFTDAAERLPVNYSSADHGRATKGAAIAMLGKTYLFDQQWAAAAEQLGKLLSSPFNYELTQEFSDNFFWQTENNSEKIFDLQFVSVDGFGSDIDTRYGFRNHPRIGQDYATASQISIEVFTNTDGTPIDLSSIPKPEDYGNATLYGTALTNWYQTTFTNADPRLHKSVILPGSTFVGAQGVVHKLYWPTGNANMTPPAIVTTFPNEAMVPIRKFVSPGEDAPLRRNAPVNWPVIRFADVLLMYAEAKNEASGPSADIDNAVNRVRRRAGIVELPAGLSKEDMRHNIRMERLRELLFEATSYFDVKRWRTAHTNDHFFGLNQDIYDFRYITKHYKKVFNENRDYLWPIPSSEIDLNPQMEQNPNW